MEMLEDRLALTSWNVATLVDNGPVEKRIDMVFVGDGFTETGLTPYIGKVNTVKSEFFLASPFDEYASYFNVHRVDVISIDSGIDPSPENDLYNTALNGHVVGDSNFLVVDQSLGNQAAAFAPDSDLLQIVLNGTGRANSPLIGKALMSIHNDTGVFLHETGHSLGRLGDEYFPSNGETYSGAEPLAPNLTAYSTEAEMIADQTKWYRWLDEDGIGLHPGGGGDGGKQYGIYRPSEWSRMRSSSHPFDVVSREALIIEMYKHPDIRTINDATPPGTYAFNHEFFVDPMNRLGADDLDHGMLIRWFVNDDLVAIDTGADMVKFNPATLSLPRGEYTLRVEVVDNTNMVRDEDARAMFLTDSMEWTFNGSIEVQTETDENGTNPLAMSLREALYLAANETDFPGLDQIVFAPWVRQINLTEGALVIDSNVNIIGPGADLLAIHAGGNSRAVAVMNTVTASMSGLTITGGYSTASNGGAAIHNAGELSLDAMVFTGNDATSHGGAIYSTKKLRVSRSTFNDNTAGNSGGAILVLSNHTNALVVESSTFYDNHSNDGGAIRIHGSSGGVGTATITNSTFSANMSTQHGGAIRMTNSAPELTITNSTITLNEAAVQGGGIHVGGGIVKLFNTIVAGNLAATANDRDILGSINSASSHNLFGMHESGQPGTKELTNDPGLLPLGNYGGPTKTHALSPTSPAIDKGNDIAAQNASLNLDQRRNPRFYDKPGTSGTDGDVDIGAVEYILPKVANVIVSSTVHNPYDTNPPFAFDTVVGTEDQLRTVPVGAPNRISVQFNEYIAVALTDLELLPLNVAVAIPMVVSFVGPEESNDYTATWTFASALLAAQYLLRLPDSVLDFQGQALDGEWTNPVSINTNVVTSVFPSGDDTEGGDFTFVFSILYADANRDLLVNIADLGQIATYYGQSNMTWSHGDFGGDGVVNITDLGAYGTYVGKNWQDLMLLGDFNGNFEFDEVDEALFANWYFDPNPDLRADLDGDGDVDSDDYDFFYERLGIKLAIEV